MMTMIKMTTRTDQMAEEIKDNKKSSGGASWLDTLVNRYLRFYGSSDALLEKDFNLVRDMDPELATGLWQAEVKAMMDLQTLKTMFYSEDWVYICIDRLAGAVASCPLRVMKGELVDGKMVYKPEEGNPVQKLIDNPNAFQDYYAWMYHITADLYRDWETDRKSTRLNSSHSRASRMPSSA